VRVLYVQISAMNASVAIVIVGDEKNISLSWTTDFPPVLLTDELDDQSHDRCNNFGRIAIRSTKRYFAVVDDVASIIVR